MTSAEVKYAALNELAEQGGIVILGGEEDMNLPLCELKQAFSLNSSLYNRSVQGLSVNNAKAVRVLVMDPNTGDVTAKGLCERIGLDGRLTHKVPATDKKVEKDIPMPTHKEAIEAVMAILVDPVDGVIKTVIL